MTEAESRPPRAAPEHRDLTIAAPADSGTAIALPGRWPSSAQVSWFSVHEHVAERLERVGSWPMAGTPAWCDLPDEHPAKTAALLDAARHWALRVETCQQAECEASRDISAAYDWGRIGRRIRDEAEFYNDKPYLKRRAS